MGDTETAYLPHRDLESLKLLYGVCNRDPGCRIQVLDTVMGLFEGWLEGYASPTIAASNAVGNQKPISGQLGKGVNGFVVDFNHLIREQLPDILRLAVTCPFSDVREKCSYMLNDLQDRGVEIPRVNISGPSSFIPMKEVISVDTEEDSTQSEFVDAFLHNNRLDHLVQVLGYHPQYLDCFLRTQNYVLRGDGPLPYDYRHYIAIMAAGRHQCSYLINIQSTEFLLQGGDERWLKGIAYAPKKLQDLYEVNKLMAHRPWLITKAHIEKLTKSSDQGSQNWSVSELMHATVLLAHFHALASFVYGCGINPEIDHDDGHTFRPPLLSDNSTSTEDLKSLSSSAGTSNGVSTTPTSSSTEEGGIGALIENMKRLHQDVGQEEMSQEEHVKRFERVGALNAELPAGSRQLSPNANIVRFVEDPDFTYQDFAKLSVVHELPTFRAQDYSWDDHGFSLANRLYSDIGNLLDDKFKMAAHLTYYTMGDTTDVDTSSFRAAIHYYIHCMFGIRHDDYDYNAVNQLLERNLKAYIKTATCFPERVTKRDYDSFMREFKHSEKVHVNIMLFEARLQAELLYALRAINQHLT